MTTPKPLVAAATFFFAALWAITLGLLFRFRVLPFLKDDTILSGGKQVPTEQFAHIASNFFWGAAAVVIVFGVVVTLSLKKSSQR